MCMLEIYACLFFSFPTTLQLNRLFWAASWALRAPHKGEEDTARHSQRAFRLANTVPFDSPHSSDFSQAAEIAGWKGERESERKEKGEKNDRKDWIAQGESQGTEQKKGRGRKETEEELWMSMRSLIYILFVLCEHLRIISIQIRSGAQTPRRLSLLMKPLHVSHSTTKQSHMTVHGAGLLSTSQMEHLLQQTSALWDNRAAQCVAIHGAFI